MTGRGGVEWLAPATLEEAIALRAERGEDSTVVAGGSFLGILINQGFLQPTSLMSLRNVAGLRRIRVEDGELRLGAMTTHRDVERDEDVRRGWPVVARAFGVVASPRVRNQATVGGVLADADYASDPRGGGGGRGGPRTLRAAPAGGALRARRSGRAAPRPRPARGADRRADPRLL